MSAPILACGSTCENPGGEFTYPPGVDGLRFNDADTLRAEWETNYTDDLDCVLSIWYWQNDDDGWLPSNYNQSVACNGTQDVPLNLLPDAYWGQLNLNHTFPNGSFNKILSAQIDVGHDPAQDGRLWAASSDSEPTATNGLDLVTSTPPSSTRTDTPNAANDANETDSTSSPNRIVHSSSQGLSPAAIAVIVVCVLVSIGLIVLAVFGFRWWKKRKHARMIAAATVPPGGDHPDPSSYGNYYPLDKGPNANSYSPMVSSGPPPLEKSATSRDMIGELSNEAMRQPPAELAGSYGVRNV